MKELLRTAAEDTALKLSGEESELIRAVNAPISVLSHKLYNYFKSKVQAVFNFASSNLNEKGTLSANDILCSMMVQLLKNSKISTMSSPKFDRRVEKCS